MLDSLSRLTGLLVHSCPACVALGEGRKCPDCDEVRLDVGEAGFGKRIGQDREKFLKLYTAFDCYRRREGSIDQVLSIALPMQATARMTLKVVGQALTKSKKASFEQREYLQRGLRMCEKVEGYVSAFLKLVTENRMFEATKQLELLRAVLQELDLVSTKAPIKKNVAVRT